MNVRTPDRSTLAAIGVSAIVLALNGCGGSAPPTPPASSSPAASPGVIVGPGEAWIAFQYDGGIRLMRPDGTGAHVAFPSVPGGEQLHPDWSPDGQRISFSVDGPTRDIWGGGADGSDVAKIVDCVAPCAWVDEAAWSPDGRSLAYHRMVDDGGFGVSTLEVLELASNRARVVLTAPRGRAFYQPRWSPDGSKLVSEFVKMAGTGFDSDVVGVALAIVDVTAASPTANEITDVGDLTNSPDWSRATDLIVFAQPSTSAGFDGPSDLVTIKPDGSSRKVVLSVEPRGGQTPQPAWTPDGSRIVYVDPDSAMFTVVPDGSDVRPAVAGGLDIGLHPRYRPLP